MKKLIEQHLFFPRSDVKMLSTVTGLKINLKSCKSKGKPGTPDFPGKIIKVALPEHTKAAAVVETIEKSTTLTKGPELVSCIQPANYVFLDENNERVSSGEPYFNPNMKEYKKHLKTLQPVVKLLKTEWIDNIPMAVLEVIPIRYLNNGNIELTEIIKLEIEVEDFKYKSPVPYSIRKKRLRDLGKVHRMVANPNRAENMSFAPKFDTPESFQPLAPTANIPDDVDYLIITDNQKWNATSITPGAATGDMVAEFQRLTLWKTQRGLRCHIAIVQDIVDGFYGNFKTGATDLQEVIRNFLKSFCGSKGVEWVLIGGDINVIPVRKVCASAANRIRRGEAAEDNTGTTEDGVLSGGNTFAWMGTFVGMQGKLDHKGNPVYGSADHILTNYITGEIIPYDSAGTSNTTTPGWYFCTDDTFSTQSLNKTQWIRVNGPKAKINETMVWYMDNNTIPTDLYYSSLYSTHYNKPGKKDWDLLQNGIYGQHNNINPHLDGMDFYANIGLGRAPVDNVADAATFVNKVIEYEQWDLDPANNPLTRFRMMLYVQANWGEYTRIKPDDTNSNPPVDLRYFSNLADRYSLLNVKLTPPDVGKKLVCEFSENSRWEINYNPEADASHSGWYYAKSETDLSPSVQVVDLFSTTETTPIPTPWIVVFSAVGNAQLTPMYYALDNEGPDLAMTEQETLREWMKSHYYKIDQIQRLYTDETDLNTIDLDDDSLRHLTAENLEFALNMGPHFVSFSGHGNWNWVAYLENDLVNRLANGNKTSIMYADSCSTNRFDNDDAVGETALKHAGGGAVAYIGNSRYSWVGIGDDFRLEFFKTMQTSRHLADLNDSRCYYADHTKLKHLWAVIALNLNGCPEMPVYRDVDDAIPRYIGNKNTLELHRQTCQWVEKMAYFNMIAYQSVQQGLNAGHDGCYYCLRQHHTK